MNADALILVRPDGYISSYRHARHANVHAKSSPSVHILVARSSGPQRPILPAFSLRATGITAHRPPSIAKELNVAKKANTRRNKNAAQASRSAGRPPLPFDRIIDAALQIADREGADALTMRALAQQLRSGTATLYRHFADRAALVTSVTDRLFAEATLKSTDLEDVNWREACRTFARRMFDVIRRHHGAAPLLLESIPSGPAAMAYREQCLVILLDNGFRLRTLLIPLRP